MLRKSKLLAATAAFSLAFPTPACAQEAETERSHVSQSRASERELEESEPDA